MKSRTLRELGDATGISVAYLSDLERGVLTNPTLDKLALIAEALEVNVGDLVGVRASDYEEQELPPALVALSRSVTFGDALKNQAKGWSTSPEVLEREWLACLASIDIHGHRPSTTPDYLFIWEAIRRTLRPH